MNILLPRRAQPAHPAVGRHHHRPDRVRDRLLRVRQVRRAALRAGLPGSPRGDRGRHRARRGDAGRGQGRAGAVPRAAGRGPHRGRADPRPGPRRGPADPRGAARPGAGGVGPDRRARRGAAGRPPGSRSSTSCAARSARSPSSSPAGWWRVPRRRRPPPRHRRPLPRRARRHGRRRRRPPRCAARATADGGLQPGGAGPGARAPRSRRPARQTGRRRAHRPLLDLADELFAVARLLDGQLALRRALSDPSGKPDDRAGLAQPAVRRQGVGDRRSTSSRRSPGSAGRARSTWWRPSKTLATEASLDAADVRGELDERRGRAVPLRPHRRRRPRARPHPRRPDGPRRRARPSCSTGCCPAGSARSPRSCCATC